MSDWSSAHIHHLRIVLHLREEIKSQNKFISKMCFKI